MYFILVSFSGRYISTTIDSVVPNYAAEQSEIEPGDKILKINNKKVRLKSDIDEAVQKSNGNKIKIITKRNNQTKEIEILPTEEITKNIGIYLGAEENDLNCEIKAIYPSSPAEEARIKRRRQYNKNRWSRM